MQRFALIVSFVAIAAVTTTGEAQRRDRGQDIPPGHRPPAGMCRIWIDGVAPGLQPTPTDCATAEREAGENSRIIYGDRTPFPGNGKGKLKKDGKEKHRDRWCDDDDRRDNRDCAPRNRDRDRDDDDDSDDDDDDENDEDDEDRDEDRRSDRNDNWERRRYPDRLPEMRTAIAYRNGQRPAQVRRWLGEGDLRVKVIDADNNGTPERVTWQNQRGALLQIWTDRNRDGRADVVEIYSNGKKVRVIK